MAKKYSFNKISEAIIQANKFGATAWELMVADIIKNGGGNKALKLEAYGDALKDWYHSQAFKPLTKTEKAKLKKDGEIAKRDGWRKKGEKTSFQKAITQIDGNRYVNTMLSRIKSVVTAGFELDVDKQYNDYDIPTASSDTAEPDTDKAQEALYLAELTRQLESALNYTQAGHRTKANNAVIAYLRHAKLNKTAQKELAKIVNG
jgi:hypothetical protein